MPEEKNNLTLYAGVIMCILAVSLLPAAGLGSTPGIAGATGIDKAGTASPFEDDGQVLIGVVAPLGEATAVCTSSAPCRVAELESYREQLSAQERAYLQIIQDSAPDSTVAFFPVKSSDDTARTRAVQSLLSMGADIIIEDIGSAYSPFMRAGALTDQISQTLSGSPGVAFAGQVHDDEYNIDILPQGMADFTLEWEGKGPEGKPAEYYLDLVDRDTQKKLSLGLQSAGSDGTVSSALFYQNPTAETVQSQLRVRSGSGTPQGDTRLSARITPGSVVIDDTVFFPEKGSTKEMTQPEYITIVRKPEDGMVQGGQSMEVPGPEPDEFISSGSPSASLVPRGDVLLISALDLSQPLNNQEIFKNTGSDTDYALKNSDNEDSVLWVLDLMTRIRDQILMKTSGLVPKQQESTGIQGSTVITAPGRYSLSSDITAPNEVIIDIRSSGVTIDGNGHIIEGKSFMSDTGEPVFQTAIAADTGIPLSDIHLSNVIISGTYNGIRVNSASGVVINGITVDATTEGIVLNASEEVLVDSCVISSSGSSGIIIQNGKNSSAKDNTIEGGINGIIIRDSDNISLVSNDITDTMYDPILQEGVNSQIVITS